MKTQKECRVGYAQPFGHFQECVVIGPFSENHQIVIASVRFSHAMGLDQKIKAFNLSLIHISQKSAVKKAKAGVLGKKRRA